MLADLYTIRVDLTLNQDISLFDEIKETILDKKYSQQGLAWLTSFAENVFADNEKQMRPIKPIQISPLDDPTIRKQINEEKKLSLKLFNETVEAQEREKQLKRKDAEQEKEFQDLTVSLAGSLVKTVLKKEVKNDAKEKRCNWQRETMGKEGAIGGDPYERGEVSGVSSGLYPKVHLTGEVLPSVAETPRFNPNVVHIDDDRDDEAENTQVGCETVFPKGAKDSWAGVEAVLAAHASHGPL